MGRKEGRGGREEMKGREGTGREERKAGERRGWGGEGLRHSCWGWTSLQTTDPSNRFARVKNAI